MSGAGVVRVTWPQVVARRLARHHLLDAPAAGVEEVVGSVGAIHAQVQSAAELSIGVRLAQGSRQRVRAELWETHRLVKTVGPRGTIHLVAADDLAMWTTALSALPSRSSHPEGIRLTPDETEQVVAAIGAALAEAGRAGAGLDLDELGAAVVAATGPWADERTVPAFQQDWARWRQAIPDAARAGVLCHGPTRNRRGTYADPRPWVGELAPMGEREALAAVLHRHLYAYGPATPAHVAQWLATPAGVVTELFESLADQLQPVALDGVAMWVSAGDTSFADQPPSGVRLLPYFDAYAVGCHPRAQVFPGAASTRALAGGQAGNFPVLLVDGVVAGVWHQKRAGKKVAVTVEPLRRLSAARRRALESQVERVGEILEAVPTLTIGEVTVGAHA